MKLKSQFADKFFISVVIVSFVGVSVFGSIENGRPSILFIPLCVSSNPNVPCIPLGGGDCSSSTGAIFCATPKPAPSNGGANRTVCPDGSIVTDATLCAGRNAPNVINKLFPGSSSTGLGSDCQIGTYWDNSKMSCVTNTDCLSGYTWSTSQQQCIRNTNANSGASQQATYQQCYDGSTVPVSVACPQPTPSTVSDTGVTQIPTKICYDGSVVTAQSNCPPIPLPKTNSTSSTGNPQYVQCQNGQVVAFGTSCPAVNGGSSNNGNGGSNSSPFQTLDTRTILIIIIVILAIVVSIVLWKSRKK